jgi:hypothetical protein
MKPLTDLLAQIPLSVKTLPWAFIAPVVTYLGGVLSKSLADSVARALDLRRERKRLRDALYQEFSENLEKLICRQVIVGVAGGGPYAQVDEWERREVYDQALKTQPVLFRDLREANFMSDFYLSLRKFRAMDAATQAQHLRDISARIDSDIEKGNLSRRRLKASYYTNPSLYRHPVSAWLKKQYDRMSYRNAPKVTRPGVDYVSYDAVETLPKKLRALWAGVPGTPREYCGPSPVGEQVFGNLYSASITDRTPVDHHVII